MGNQIERAVNIEIFEVQIIEVSSSKYYFPLDEVKKVIARQI
ncbi:MAG: hypothetical protein U9R12_04365 [Candidatus Caldatribacteriota bacterium]|nr:hypothetical protein [Candidatus Caldatribacteriota bacterium]